MALFHMKRAQTRACKIRGYIVSIRASIKCLYPFAMRTDNEANDAAVALRYLGRHCPDNEWPVKVMMIVSSPMGGGSGVDVGRFQDFGCRRARASVVSWANSGVGCGRRVFHISSATAPCLHHRPSSISPSRQWPLSIGRGRLCRVLRAFEWPSLNG